MMSAPQSSHPTNLNPVIAIIGKPNVGKSTLFNRIIQERQSITTDEPGTTRDRLYAHSEWLTRPFLIVDTGGLTAKTGTFRQQITEQAKIAIAEADIIIFLVSARVVADENDLFIQKLLQKSKKPILLVVNKVDLPSTTIEVYEYLKYGFGEPLLISAEHGRGISQLLDEIVQQIKNLDYKTDEQHKLPLIVVAGRPNVGKSSIMNQLLKRNRSAVSAIKGTTTDAVMHPYAMQGRQYLLIDTAGISKTGHIKLNLERYSILKTQLMVERAHIILLVLDLSQELSNLDAKIAGLAFQANKPVIVISNKLDLWIKNHDVSSNYQSELVAKIRQRFKFLSNCQIGFFSALTGKNIYKIQEMILLVETQLERRIKPHTLNSVIAEIQLMNPPSHHQGGRLKIYFAQQIEAVTITFILFVNNPNFMHFSYLRYIKNQLRRIFGFEFVPINIIVRSKR